MEDTKKSQKEKIIDRLNEVGYVDNFWAIDNYILRLGAIMCLLKKEGYNFKTGFGRELGKNEREWKNYYYILIVGNQMPMF